MSCVLWFKISGRVFSDELYVFSSLLNYVLIHFMMHMQFLDNVQNYLQKISLHSFLLHVVTGSNILNSATFRMQGSKKLSEHRVLGYYGWIMFCRMFVLQFQCNIQNILWEPQYRIITIHYLHRWICKEVLRIALP